MDSQTTNRLDKICEKLNSIDVTLVAQHITLKEHIRRTALIEEQINLMQKEIKPIQQHVWMVSGGLKIVSSVGVICTLIKVLSLF